jgi:AcrR family transcriptional regulator
MGTERRKYELKIRAERQERTRQRIVETIMKLHEEVGPAQTTVAEIARRARVERRTVYNHFPDEMAMFIACSSRWRDLNPRPDVSSALALEDPRERVRAVLEAHYGWFRDTQPMTEKLQRDRSLVPAVDALLRQGVDAPLAALAETLAAGFRARGQRAERLRAVLAVALEFWTWRRLAREGLADAAAAALMADVVAAA